MISSFQTDWQQGHDMIDLGLLPNLWTLKCMHALSEMHGFGVQSGVEKF